MPTPTPTPAPVHGFVDALSTGFSISHALGLLLPIMGLVAVAILTMVGLGFFKYSVETVQEAADRNAREKGFRDRADYERNV